MTRREEDSRAAPPRISAASWRNFAPRDRFIRKRMRKSLAFALPRGAVSCRRCLYNANESYARKNPSRTRRNPPPVAILRPASPLPKKGVPRPRCPRSRAIAGTACNGARRRRTMASGAHTHNPPPPRERVGTQPGERTVLLRPSDQPNDRLFADRPREEGEKGDRTLIRGSISN